MLTIFGGRDRPNRTNPPKSGGGHRSNAYTLPPQYPAFGENFHVWSHFFGEGGYFAERSAQQVTKSFTRVYIKLYKNVHSEKLKLCTNLGCMNYEINGAFSSVPGRI